MSKNNSILISSITATAKINPHPRVLTGTSGKLDESSDGKHVFVNGVGSVSFLGGPIEGELYKLRFNVAGQFENIRQMTFIGYATEYKRYIFTKLP